MRKRTFAREIALQLLYQIDITKEDPILALNSYWQVNPLGEEIDDTVKSFASELVKGALDNLKVIDETIAKYATNWQLKRMAVVDRNILRLGCFELVFREDIPPKVAINEAVELAKKFSTQEAGKFVNGILDKIKIEKNK
jgi:N utilization substance protein B